MGKRLPPGEAERRAAERKRATFAGENYRTYDVEKEGYGSYDQWAAAAAAFLDGDIIYLDTTAPKAKPAGQQEAPKAKPTPTHSNPWLATLGMDFMPREIKELTSAYRKAVFAAFRDAGSSDTSPVYVNAFMALTKAYDSFKRSKGWK